MCARLFGLDLGKHLGSQMVYRDLHTSLSTQNMGSRRERGLPAHNTPVPMPLMHHALAQPEGTPPFKLFTILAGFVEGGLSPQLRALEQITQTGSFAVAASESIVWLKAMSRCQALLMHQNLHLGIRYGTGLIVSIRSGPSASAWLSTVTCFRLQCFALEVLQSDQYQDSACS